MIFNKDMITRCSLVVGLVGAWGLLTSCDQAESAVDRAEASSVEDPVLKEEVAKDRAFRPSPHFERVMGRLDVGGKSLRFQDYEGRREALIEILDTVLKAFPPEEDSGLEIDSEALVDASGFARAVASGRSIRKDGNSWLARSYSYFPNGHGPFVKLLGDPPAPFRSGQILPAGTDFVVEAQIDTSAVPKVLLRIGKAIGLAKEADEMLTRKLPLGTTARLLLSKAKLSLVVGIDLSKWGQGETPTDFFVQIAGGQDLLEIFLPELKEDLGEPVEMGARKGWTLSLPSEIAHGEAKAVVLFDEKGLLTIASRREYLKLVESDQPKLVDDEEFMQGTNHFPTKGNLLLYGSSRLPVALFEMFVESPALSGRRGQGLAKLKGILPAKTWSFCASCERDGLVTVAETPLPVEVISPKLWPAIATVSSVGIVGQRAWRKGSERAGCIMNIRNVQQSVRSYKNMNGYDIGDTVDWSEVIGPGKFVERTPVCPSGGTYTYVKDHPKVGELACRCSLEHSESHVPTSHEDW